jgi:hypothetical protein
VPGKTVSSPPELLKTKEIVLTNSPRVFDTKLLALPRYSNASLRGSSPSQPFSKISESHNFDLTHLRPRHGKHAGNQVFRNRCVKREAERSLPHRRVSTNQTDTEKKPLRWHHLQLAEDAKECFSGYTTRMWLLFWSTRKRAAKYFTLAVACRFLSPGSSLPYKVQNRHATDSTRWSRSSRRPSTRSPAHVCCRTGSSALEPW